MIQEINKYTTNDQWVWKTLFERQDQNLTTKASEAYLNCLHEMKPVLNSTEIPDFKKVNKWFEGTTGWQIEVVKGLIPVEDFFELLAQKKFCSSTWLRSPENLDYLEEPDMFHDVFGHIPLLSHPVFSEFAYEFGKLGKKFIHNQQALVELQRLYWFTIEFGLIKEQGTKVYGAGIISSFGETNSSLTAKHLNFDIEIVLNKSFHTDVMQEEYVVVESYNQLFESINIANNLLSKKYELVN